MSTLHDAHELAEELKTLSIFLSFCEEDERILAEKDIEAKKEELKDSIDSIAHWLSRLRAEKEALEAHGKVYKDIAAAYASRARSIDRTIDWIMSGTVRQVFDETCATDKDGGKYLKTAGRTMRLTGYKSVMIDDMDEIPPHYLKIETSPNKIEIMNDLKGGLEVPGAHIHEEFKLRLY